jgi:hypothetical protein
MFSFNEESIICKYEKQEMTVVKGVGTESAVRVSNKAYMIIMNIQTK